MDSEAIDLMLPVKARDPVPNLLYLQPEMIRVHQGVHSVSMALFC